MRRTLIGMNRTILSLAVLSQNLSPLDILPGRFKHLKFTIYMTLDNLNK